MASIEAFPAGWARLGDALTGLTGGATPLGADYPDEGVRFLRVQNVMPNFIDDSDTAFISSHDDEILLRSRLKENDVLLTITGVSYGKSAVVTREFVGSNINQHSVRMELRTGTFDPFFISTFLNSRAGKLQSDQNITGVTRPALDYQAIRRFRVPLVSNALQSAVAQTVKNGQHQFTEAKLRLADAEAILLAALGLGDWQPPEPLTYTRRASTAFTASRFDAEYFHPAKKAFLDRLGAFPGKPLRMHYRPVRDVFDPSSAGLGEVVRNYDLPDALQLVLDNEQPISSAIGLGSLKKRLMNGDVVISRLRSYLREIALVRTTGDIPAVGSSEFIVLRPYVKDHLALSPAALLVFLRSQPVQTILKWSQDGSNHPRFGDEALLSIPVPDVVCATAPLIESLLEETLAARARARTLLAQAKRAVEITIEQSETEALAFLANAQGM